LSYFLGKASEKMLVFCRAIFKSEINVDGASPISDQK
jgi:hypothetical protein